MEHTSSHDEESEEGNLDEKTDNNDVCPRVILDWLFAEERKPPPAHWARKEITSPQTKILVSHFTRMRESCSWLVEMIERPRIIYMDAAKNAGAIRSKSDCMIYRAVVQSGILAS
jgi:hypothetical protein